MANDVTVVSETTNERYRVRLLAPGDRYGLDNKLTADRALVEFYDLTPERRMGRDAGGQFVARYHLEVLLEHDAQRGLDLSFGKTFWKIDAKALDQALTGLLAGRRDLP